MKVEAIFEREIFRMLTGATPMEKIQDSWRRRWTDPDIERPSCYNRADDEAVWLPGCPHWRPMGNAHVTPKMVDRGGKWVRWVACNGCGQKELSSGG